MILPEEIWLKLKHLFDLLFFYTGFVDTHLPTIKFVTRGFVFYEISCQKKCPALEPEISHWRLPMKIPKVKIDQDACSGCKLCVEACFMDVIRWDSKAEKPVAAYPEDCQWCLFCEDACPVQCIEVIPPW
jgi:NAD-dependent dihydropyrimidine dehydrogenase PreA subunit